MYTLHLTLGPYPSSPNPKVDLVRYRIGRLSDPRVYEAVRERYNVLDAALTKAKTAEDVDRLNSRLVRLY